MDKINNFMQLKISKGVRCNRQRKILIWTRKVYKGYFVFIIVRSLSASDFIKTEELLYTLKLWKLWYYLLEIAKNKFYWRKNEVNNFGEKTLKLLNFKILVQNNSKKK